MAKCDKCGSEYSALLLENCPKCKDRNLGEVVSDVVNDVSDTVKKTVKLIFE